MTQIMNTEEIKQVIPNRYPIYYMDQVIQLVPGETITAVKNVTVNEDFMQGNFPEDPHMPGTLILEALAQAGSILILKSPQFAGQTAYIGGIDKAQFIEKVRAGDVLHLKFTITKIKGNVGRADAVATVAGKTTACCCFTFIVGAK
ncbi:3-hydroxyacyl-ACP dehydratase FabZ [Candidatus Enterococcus leclercqii]|uniref:3-hydroxyacyl-ACP dehydratase FabZ n=1 Tax=Candidatus Enterococcus leclercqii TaxID=1857218 RepID=UPI00137B50B1|nr:3-hydroxyacyl-ACP dehydratase FabZ [Enterococcus sp. CU9D]KAF1292308.1 3-hydroxyacyl-[acyl-carrier-protein] dehydratase FabZ [Enterococcus sp. CU9D]